MNNNRVSSHNFHRCRFNRPTWCDFCKKFIKNPFGKQGYKCSRKSCGYHIHKKCFEACLQTVTCTEAVPDLSKPSKKSLTDIHIVLLGDNNCGKSSFFRRIKEDMFDLDYQVPPTPENEPALREVDYKGENITLSVFDTGGQERWREMTKTYFYGAQCIVLMYDLNNPNSFANLEKHLSSIEKRACENAVTLVIGNKSDLEEQFVDTATALQFCQDRGLDHMEISCLTGDNIDIMLDTIIQRVDELNL
eukprot:TRINITY_DN12234_c0_g1_i1.p1 TRINITY_DN12234_c0_g1~~TRINITY_DN12234_c0_g1_i1.p1  ORF type:complete len:248 (-),score=33.30 TRINITY_DN12234_c0_g1_i1:35-778(-)